jgi:hypothetical protein
VEVAVVTGEAFLHDASPTETVATLHPLNVCNPTLEHLLGAAIAGAARRNLQCAVQVPPKLIEPSPIFLNYLLSAIWFIH